MESKSTAAGTSENQFSDCFCFDALLLADETTLLLSGRMQVSCSLSGPEFLDSLPVVAGFVITFTACGWWGDCDRRGGGLRKVAFLCLILGW